MKMENGVTPSTGSSAMTRNKKVIIIAGPNGAGQTTFAREFLPGEASLPIFVNADLIAAGLSPFSPDLVEIRAGRIMLREIDDHADAGRSFAFETTLAGHTYLRRVDVWRKNGYVVKLIFPLVTIRGRSGSAGGRAGERRWTTALRRRSSGAALS
jgi:predicted ABC-type ATPase